MPKAPTPSVSAAPSATERPPIQTLRILGVDPGLRITGFGVIEQTGTRLNYIASGVIRTPDGELPERLRVIFDGLREVVATYAPACAAIEKVFVNVNPQSTLLLGQARGAAITALVTSALNVAEYTALQTKQATVGHGKAKKEQVQSMVQRLLKLPGLPGPDAADALACAICHANAQGGKTAINIAIPGFAKAGLRVRGGRFIAS